MPQTTNTNIKIDSEVMDQFKDVLKKQGIMLHRGAEIAFIEYVKKYGKLDSNKIFEGLR